MSINDYCVNCTSYMLEERPSGINVQLKQEVCGSYIKKLHFCTHTEQVHYNIVTGEKYSHTFCEDARSDSGFCTPEGTYYVES